MYILLIDDHPIFGLGLEMFLKKIYPDMTAVRETTLAAGLAKLGEQAEQLPDLILTDLEFRGEAEDLEALIAVRQVAPQIATVVISANQSSDMIRESIEWGASGFIHKSSEPDELEQALTEVISGEVYLPPVALSGMKKEEAPNLTARKREILQLLVRGLSNKEIARELHISDQTVKTHMSELFQILDAHNRTQVLYRVARLGIRLRGKNATDRSAS